MTGYQYPTITEFAPGTTTPAIEELGKILAKNPINNELYYFGKQRSVHRWYVGSFARDGFLGKPCSSDKVNIVVLGCQNPSFSIRGNTTTEHSTEVYERRYLEKFPCPMDQIMKSVDGDYYVMTAAALYSLWTLTYYIPSYLRNYKAVVEYLVRHVGYGIKNYTFETSCDELWAKWEYFANQGYQGVSVDIDYPHPWLVGFFPGLDKRTGLRTPEDNEEEMPKLISAFPRYRDTRMRLLFTSSDSAYAQLDLADDYKLHIVSITKIPGQPIKITLTGPLGKLLDYVLKINSQEWELTTL